MWICLAVLIALILAGCDALPCGAGVQSEVLAEATDRTPDAPQNLRSSLSPKPTL